MPELVIPVMGIIWSHLALIIFIVLFFRSRNKIRLALIESGRDASIFRKPVNRLNTLKNGLVLVMGGAGLLIGTVFDAMGVQDGVAYIAPVLLLIGFGLVGFYTFLQRNRELGEPEDLV